tara:strand:+ start:44762 stop:45952 length:1191 start_codon:yes stop_codon:yes gene_type:complete
VEINKEFERVLNLSDFDLDYESLKNEFIDLNKLAARIAGTEISQLNLIDHFTQWSISQVGTKKLQAEREETICTYTIKGKEPLEVIDLNKDERFQHLESVKKAGAKYYYGIPLVSKEGFNIGSLCVISLKELSLSEEKKELLILVAEEIVHRLEDLRVLNKLKNENHNLKSAKKEIVHDLRGMINGIMGLGDLISLENNSTNKEIDKFLKLQKGSCKSIVEYAESILDRSQEQNKVQTNVKELSEKLERLYLPLAIRKGIEFEVVFDENDIDLSFEGRLLVQITGNLISNAMKFSSKNGRVKVEFQILKKTINEEEKDFKRELKILVKDSGEGMDSNRVENILNKKNISTEGTSGEQGFGLGLNFVQYHIHELNGSLEVNSSLGKGSNFSVSIPIS